MYDVDNIFLEVYEDDSESEKIIFNGEDIKPVEHKRTIELEPEGKELQSKNYFGTFSKVGDSYEQITLVYTVNLGARVHGYVQFKHKGFVKDEVIQVKSEEAKQPI